MIVIMAIVGYHSVFITKSKYTFENTVYCKLLDVEKFCGFFGQLIGNHKLFQHNNIASNNTYAKWDMVTMQP